MDKTELQKVLDRFRDAVVSQSKRNLTRLQKNSSKKLYNSIKGKVKAYPNSFHMQFTMEDYGFYQDKGVSGKNKKYNTPYSYKSKMPPSKAFDKWIVRKGLAPRGADGKFLNRKSLSFLIARSVYRNGIKPTMFFTKPFEAAYKNLPDDMVERFGLEVEELFNQMVITNKNG
jgi:hypothetical protein